MNCSVWSKGRGFLPSFYSPLLQILLQPYFLMHSYRLALMEKALAIILF